MLATLTEGPFSDSRFLFEPKLDGYRVLAFLREGGVKLESRRGLDVTGEYPELARELARQRISEAVLDGEVVALDEQGRPCFQCLQQRAKPEQAYRAQVLYYVFDLLYLAGYDLQPVPLLQRKEVLRSALRPTERVRLLEHFEGDGQIIYEAALKEGFEGVIAKRKDSRYEAGRRSSLWLKVKAVLSDDFVIGGYTRGTGYREHTFGALLLGYYDEAGRLIYSGHVGSGFNEEDIATLYPRLQSLRTDWCPFASPPPQHAAVTWVRPELVAEVKFAQWTQEGYLRAPVFLRLHPDKPVSEVRRSQVVTAPARSESSGPTEQESILEQLQSPKDSLDIKVEGHRVAVTNLDKALWPATEAQRALTKRALLLYLARVSPFLLPQLKDRPLTLTRYPHGIGGEHFYQKHWQTGPLPEFVETVRLSEHGGEAGDYLLCHNLATLLWLGQLANLEFHTWFSRVSPRSDRTDLYEPDKLAGYPDFIIFDIDPYIYSGQEARGAEPELNRQGFAQSSQVALWLKEVLASLSMAAFVKTSGKTGLHVYVPIVRQFDFHSVHAAAKTVAHYLLEQHPGEITMEWAVEKRTGKVFVDYNQNVRGKTLACAYSPRPAPEATISTPLRWEEVGKVYPTDFTILSIPTRLARVGDLWANMLEAKRDLKGLLSI